VFRSAGTSDRWPDSGFPALLDKPSGQHEGCVANAQFPTLPEQHRLPPKKQFKGRFISSPCLKTTGAPL